MKTLLRFNRHFIIGYLLVLIFFAYHLKDLEFIYKIDRFFPTNNPHLTFLKKYESKLEADDNYLLTGIDHQKSIFDSTFLNKVEAFSDSVNSLEQVQKVSSITNIKEPIKGPFGFIESPILHFKQPERYKADSTEIFNDPRWPNYLISKDAEAITLLVKTKPYLSQDSATIFINNIRDIVEDFGFPKVHFAGRTISQVTFVERIQKEVVFYIVLCTVILLLILFLIYRKPLGILIPMTSVIMGMVLFFGILGFFGIPLDIMSTLYPTLMLIIGMSDVIHIKSKYLDELERGNSRIHSMHTTIREIGFATLLTSLTTSIGFLALLSSQIPPLKNFGIYAAVGVFIAYLTVIFFTTMVLVNFDAHQLTRKQKRIFSINPFMGKIFSLISRNQKSIWVASLIIIGISIWGITKISQNVYMLTDVPENSKIRKDFRFFENKFAGVRALEIAAMPKSGYSIKSPEVVKAINNFEDHLESHKSINHLISPLTVYRTINKSLSNGNPEAYEIPNDSTQFQKIRDFIDRGRGTVFSAVISKDGKMGRITGRMNDIGSDSVEALYEKIRDWEKRNVDSSVVDFRITGKLYLVDKNNDYLLANLLTGLGLAFLVVGALMVLLFRQFKMLFISLIPNVIPLIIAGAVMGFTGISLKATTSIIFTIAFGIAVDDTIHFLSRFKIEKLKGAGRVRAVQKTFMETGKAITFTTIILLAGFTTLMFSDFTVTYYIGFLTGITLLSALLTDLLLLPLLLYRFYR